jgi:hypothetical protein
MRGTERIDRKVREWRSGIAHVSYPSLTRAHLLNDVGN